MNLKIFAEKFLNALGLFNVDSDYDGALGRDAMELIEIFRRQGHSGLSGAKVAQLFHEIMKAYSDENHEIWKEYWQSDEGQKLKNSF